MKLLDLYCGAGGAGMGYHRAGFDVVGVDIKPQPRYPFEFHQGDALEYCAEHWQEFDAIHASPPCQFGSWLTPTENKPSHKNWIPDTRKMLQFTTLPYVIENVAGVRFHLVNPLMLCGSMFGLKLWRHRYFEVVPTIAFMTPPCDHSFAPVLISGSPRRNGCRKEPNAKQRREAMDTSWMTIAEMDEAIPPAYTEFIGKQLMEYLLSEKEAAA
jgi:DNA (cytosine-5)-methyltransferase 1